MDSLGYIARHLGALDEAVARYQCALAETLCAQSLGAEAREVWWQAHDAYAAQQRAHDAAEVWWRECFDG